MIEGKDKKLIKDCSLCLIPHTENGYDYIMKKLEASDNEEIGVTLR